MMTTFSTPNTSSSINESDSISDGFNDFKVAIAHIDKPGSRTTPATYKPKPEKSKTEVLKALAEYCIRYPIAETQAIEFTAELLSLSIPETRKAVETHSEILSKSQRYQDAFSSLVEKVDADFNIHDLLPPSVASLVESSCNRTSSDWTASVFFLLTVTASMIGSRIMVHSGMPSTEPIAANLYAFSVGDSSSDKSKTSKKFSKPLKKLMEKVSRVKDQRKKAALEIVDEADKRKTLASLDENLHEYFFEAISFSAEAFLKDLGKQEPRAALHIHQDEGSDLFGCDRYSKVTDGISLFMKVLTEAYSETMTGRNSRTNAENSFRFRNQTICITANVQKRLINRVIDFAEDTQGWCSRVLVFESKRLGDDITTTAEDPDIYNDPIFRFLLERLFPFCIDLTNHDWKGTDVFGDLQDFAVLKLDAFDGAQDKYNQYVLNSMNYADELEKQGRESALRSFIRKVGIRVMKFALLLHILEVQQGMRFDKDNRDELGFPVPMGDPFFKLTNVPISIDTLERALKLEGIARAQFQHVADICRSAPSIREEEMKRESELATLQFILDKVRILGSVKEGDFKKKYKGSKGLTREDISGALEVLNAAGCIVRNKPQGQRSNHLTYIKELR